MDSGERTRLPGVLWLMAVVTGGFSLSYIRSNIIVVDNAAATAANIAASEFPYRAAIVSGLVSELFLFFLGLTLFQLFAGVNKRMARAMLASILISVGIAVVNMLNHFAALFILSHKDFLNAFNGGQLNALAMVFLRLANSSGQGLLEIFWTPYYFCFGLLALRSRSLPNILGILLMVMSGGFAVNILQKFLFPQFYPALFTQLAMALGALGGIPTTLWLLIKGAKIPQPLRNSELQEE